MPLKAFYIVKKSIYCIETPPWLLLLCYNKKRLKEGGGGIGKRTFKREGGLTKTNNDEQGEGGGKKLAILSERTIWMTPRPVLQFSVQGDPYLSDTWPRNQSFQRMIKNWNDGIFNRRNWRTGRILRIGPFCGNAIWSKAQIEFAPRPNELGHCSYFTNCPFLWQLPGTNAT